MNTSDNENPLFRRAKERDRFWIETAILEFTEEITTRMNALGVNKTELANRLQVQPAFITKLLSGSNNFTVETMVKASRALDSDLRIHLQPRGTASQWFDVLKDSAVQPQSSPQTWGDADLANFKPIPLTSVHSSHEPVRATA